MSTSGEEQAVPHSPPLHRPGLRSPTLGLVRGRSVWLEGLGWGLLALVALLVMDAYVRDSPAPRNDEQIYALMAEDPFEAHTFPFAFRVGVPTLVHVLPLDQEFAFSLLAWLATAGCATLAYVLMRRFNIGKGLCAGIAVAFALSPTLFVVSLRQGYNVDPESVLVMFAGTLAIVERRPLVLGLVVLVGAFVRESALFLVPLAYAIWAERPFDPIVAARTLAVCAPGLVAYLILRLSVPSVAREQVLGYSSLIGGRLDVLEAAAEAPQYPLRRVAYAFGPLWAAAPFALRDLSFARRGLVLVGACAIGMTFALDWGRVIVLAAPVILVAAGWALRDKPRLAALAVAAFLALDVGYVIYMEDLGGAQDGIIDVGPAPYEIR
jgi:hypothetical protein